MTDRFFPFRLHLSASAAGGMAPEDQRKQTEADLDQRLKELEIVNAISISAASMLDLASLLTLAGDKISEAFNHRSVMLAIYDAPSGMIFTPYWNIRGQLVNAPPMPMGQGLTTRVLLQRKPLLLDKDLFAHATALGADFSMAGTHGVPKSWVGVPMIAREQVVGMICIQDYELEHAFSEGDIRLMQTIAANVAIAIQNSQLYETAQKELEERKCAEAEANQRADQMTAVNIIGRAITNQLELDSVLTTLRIQCQQVAPMMDVFSVALYNERRATFEFLQFYDRGILRGSKPRHIRKKEGGVTARVITSRKTIYIPDVTAPETKQMVVAVHTGKEHARSYVGIPLMVGEKIIGVLSGQSYQPAAFTAQHIELLETIALQAAIALQNANLFEETSRRANEMSILYDISLALSSNLELEQVLHNLFKKCRQVLPMDSFYIALYAADSHMLSHPLFWDNGKLRRAAVRDIHTTPGLSGEVILGQKTIHIPDILEPEIRQKYQIIHLGGKPTRSYVGVPMIIHGHTIGVISMQTKEPNSYTPEHVRLLEMIAIQAAIVIDNSRLYRQAQEELAERRHTQQSLEKANEQLQIQLAQVEALQDKLREQVLRDPLTGLHNRRYLNEQLKGLINNARARQKRVCIIMLDIDHFKNFNDTHSHLAGDELLVALAELLREHTRPTDITCRYGGEEFILVLPDTNLEIATRRAEELRTFFEKTAIQFQEKTLKTTLSLGIASYPEHGATVEELVMHADEAMYIAKANGRNQVAVWRS
jgi:diguanylate cyclase (GGDEF)-like protein